MQINSPLQMLVLSHENILVLASTVCVCDEMRKIFVLVLSYLGSWVPQHNVEQCSKLLYLKYENL